MRRIYMDNSATTRVSTRAYERTAEVLRDSFGNPSSIYGEARDAKIILEEARSQVASVLNSRPEEIYFTGSGTEADNWAIRSAFEKNGRKGHLITTAIEHHAVLHTCEYLEKQGCDVTYLPVEEDGIISLEKLRDSIRPDTFLITIMYANNEVGTIQPVAEIAALAREHKILFHTDAVQAFGKIPIDVKELGVDMLSVSAHKIHGPKGVGCLYVRKGVNLPPFLLGGAQERKKRAGTENLASIAGFGVAAVESMENRQEKNRKLKEMTGYLVERVLREIPYTRLNGDQEKRIPGNVNFSFQFVEGESLLLLLENQGIMASSGSACTSGSLDPSHVLLAMGLPHEIAHGSLRISLDSEENNMEDVRHLADVLPGIISRLRDMSPLYEDHLKGCQTGE